ncbi:hypothetical protein F4801DRAFT_587499 [Xylaria longipes]|nr:hypothetical protein F4801DRAFT_587499 [Xylaria longipes]
MADQSGLEVVFPTDPKIVSQSRSTSQKFPTYVDTYPEVVPLELLHRQSLRPEAIQLLEESEKIWISGSLGERNHGLANLTPKFFKGRYGRLILVGVGIFIVVIVASVVGGVIGSRGSDSVSSTPKSGSPTPSSSSPTSTLTPSRPLQSNSGLAVAGWRTGDFFNLRVFYQDQDDGLRFSDYRSDGSGWGNSIKVEREAVLSNTTLGATAILEWNPPQYELFFQNTSSLVTGNNFRDRVTGPGGGFDSIDEYPILAHSRSRLSTCWPYIVLQKPNLTLHVVNWVGAGENLWQNQSLGITALEGTSLAVLPLSISYEAPYGAALVYRGSDGLLALRSLEYGTTGSKWYVVARENDPNNATNIYILYQTESNGLEYVYYHGDSWKLGPASDVLKSADASTDITCLTESILWFDQAAMSPKYDMSRCYFYSGGRIKQVHFGGTTWTEMEPIPYP